MSFEDMGTAKLKRHYFKWVKKTWKLTYSAFSTRAEVIRAAGNRDKIKTELSHRGWYL